MGKGSKARVVPISGEARKSLKRYLEIRPRSDDWLWKSSDGQQLTPRGIQMMIVHLKRRAGIKGGGWTAPLSPLLCHPLPGGWGRPEHTTPASGACYLGHGAKVLQVC